MADSGEGPGTDLQVPDGGQAPPLGPGGPGQTGGPPGSPPGGGQGPILAALSRRAQGPGLSAPGQGDQAASLVKVQQAIGLLQDALQGLAPGSPPHKDTLNALNRLSKHMPQQAPTAGVQATQLGDMLRSTLKNALLQRIASGGKGGAGGGQPPAPTPSTPLPGA
jgi:hypothetical protein